MMRLNSRTSYGIQALFDLALRDGQATQARDIAERRAIPLRYLEQVLRDLRRARLVVAKRGPGGGYALSRAASDIRLVDVVTACESDRKPAHSAGGDAPDTRPAAMIGVDVPALIFRELSAQVDDLYAGVTLQDMVLRARTLDSSPAAPEPQMYFI